MQQTNHTEIEKETFNPSIKNKALSWMHYSIAVISAFDAIYIVNYVLDASQESNAFMTGRVIGKIMVIALHVIAAREVKKGRRQDRLFSLFLTFFVLFAFPIGTIFGVIMLILIFRWQSSQN